MRLEVRSCHLYDADERPVRLLAIPKFLVVGLYEWWSKRFEPGYLRLDFWAKNVTGFNSRLLLVFLKNYMSSACLLYQIQLKTV